MSDQINHLLLPQHIRMLTDEALDLDWELGSVYTCDICHVFLLSEKAALNHKKCTKKLPPIRKTVTLPEKHILLQSIQQQLGIMENNKNDVATKKQSYTPVCTNDSHCGPDDATSVMELNKQKISIIFKDEVADQLTACENITNGEQSALIKQEALLEDPTTSTFTQRVCAFVVPFNEPTFQCLSCCSMVESFKNEINILKTKHAELEKKVNIGPTDKMVQLMEDRDHYKLLCLSLLKENLEAANNHQNSKIKLRKLKEEILSLLKTHCMEL